MSEKKSTAATPKLKASQRWNAVWLVPILCLLIGGWMLYQNVSSKGQEIRLRFQTAEGIIAGKTELRCRSVSIGKVKKIELSEDLQSTFVYCVLNRENEKLLRKGSRFWVVRPRVSAGDISGLGTLLTGVYIELEPGTGPLGPKNWIGRETPPPTSRRIPGLRLVLSARESGTLAIGAPVNYLGFEVGKVESQKLDSESQQIFYKIFINEKYKNLVRKNTKFWNTSGIDIIGGVDGFKLKTNSIQSLVTGGVSFAVNEGMTPSEVAEDGTIFTLYKDEQMANHSGFNPTLKLLLLFDQSVRGLSVSAPVEYRGIVIGRVKSISFDHVASPSNRKVPVLIELDPSLLRAIGAVTRVEDELLLLGNAVKNGLRAALKTGNLLTGALYVDFDYYPKEAKSELSYEGDLPVVPTLNSGLAQMETKIFAILDKIEKLPLEDAVNGFTATAAEAEKTIKQMEKLATAAKEILEDENFKKLPTDLRENLVSLKEILRSAGPDGNLQGDLLRTMDELRSALRAFESLSESIEEKPNSLLFGKEESGNPIPKAAGKD